jgi:peptidoglycan/xylan/chitin deacetylase (PgdA/CDA1 family)
MEIALSIVADSRKAVREGLPALVDLLDRQGVAATFFLNFGLPAPETVPRQIPPPPLPKEGLLVRLFGRERALPDEAPLAGELEPLLPRLVSGGHEIAFRPWAPAKWEEALAASDDATLREELEGAARAMAVATGERPKAFASVDWKVSPALLALEDERKLLYASDTRGTAPFLSTLAGKRFRTLQVPTTLPTWTEVLGSPGLDDESLLAFYRAAAREGIAQVHRIHAEIEGGSHLPLFERLLASWKRDGVRFARLETVARRAFSKKTTLKLKAITTKTVPGHDGPVACEE